jgi:hypothetical protein
MFNLSWKIIQRQRCTTTLGLQETKLKILLPTSLQLPSGADAVYLTISIDAYWYE